VPNLRVDNRGAMQAAVDHLASLGRRRLLCIAGDRDWLITRARLDAVLKRADTYGMELDPSLVRYSGGFTAEAGASAIHSALAENVEFDAVLAFNDYAAVGAMGVLARMHRRIPDEIAIMGCDDTDMSAYARVPLTTIRFPAARLGSAAIEILCDGAPVPTEAFGYELIVRESTGGRSPNS
jgi:DNA-binding LacI/PurR family transcriptional regulator